MTNFLEVGFMKENLAEAHKKARYLKTLLQMSADERDQFERGEEERGRGLNYLAELTGAIDDVIALTGDMAAFLDGFPSAPIVYTGEATTEEVIALLERLLRTHRAETSLKKAT